jgi:hypothetical protein
MSDYTPATDRIRDFYIDGTIRDVPQAQAEGEFDRWLAEHDRQVKADAWEDAADKLETVVDFWRSCPDDWRFETGGDTRNWLMDVASDMRAGRPIVLADEEATDV